MNVRSCVMKLSAALALCASALCGGALAADPTPPWRDPIFDDPIHTWPNFLDYDTNEDYYYNPNGSYSEAEKTGYGYHYQVRDVSGSDQGHTLAKAQWFATSYENFMSHYYYYRDQSLTYVPPLYRRTLGGEMPEIPMTTSADLLYDFDHVYIDEPEPYPSYPTYLTQYHDQAMDPIESICVIIPNGRGELGVKFANHYARHFPYWWDTENYPPINPGLISGDVVSKDPVSGDVIVSGDIDPISRDVMEDLRINAEDYTFTITPTYPQRIEPGQYLDARIRINAVDAEEYGSTLGYLSFRQSASFDTGYIGWRESIQIPIVIANVFDGPASEQGNELYFDMIIFDRLTYHEDGTYTRGEPLNRIKFRWGADEDMTQNLGNLFVMRPHLNDNLPTYQLETRVTNRTGTRYRVQRYDMLGLPDGYHLNISTDTAGNETTIITDAYDRIVYNEDEIDYRPRFRDIRPDHWSYDLTQDLYGTLPERFQLDAHSQIAPGLTTVYRNQIGRREGLGSIDTSYGTSESFRLYRFADAVPHDLRLSYRRIGGMTLGTGSSSSNNRWRTRSFGMQFVDIIKDEKETVKELTELMGKPPVMLSSANSVSARDVYIRSSALNSFEISDSVPAGVVTVSEDVVSRDADGNPTELSFTSVDIAVQPVQIRLRIPRQEQLLVGRWESLNEEGLTNREILNRFARFGTIWLRSDNPDERDTNMFTAISNRGVEPSECIRAFTYEDELYLDFFVFLADGKSPLSNYSAYLYCFEDDEVPYILIGDGAEDGQIKMTFYIDSNGANPVVPVSPSPSRDGEEGGGGCSAAQGYAAVAMLAVAALFSGKRRQI